MSRIVLLFQTSGDFDDRKNPLRDNCVTDFPFWTMDTGVKASKYIASWRYCWDDIRDFKIQRREDNENVA